MCNRIEKQPNAIKITVLQHPDETSNPKGSAIIAELGLQQYQRWIGEDFKHHQGLNEMLAKEPDNIALLYPADNSSILSSDWCENQGKSINSLIVIDGTWRKARKIWEINPQLHGLPTIRLNNENKSEYRIRKAPRDGYLSTVECIVVSLRELEGRPQGYQPLLELFSEMIDFQIEKMGKRVYLENYSDE